jgi:transposase
VVWDHAAFHLGKLVGEVGLRRVYQPPYSSELNPKKRVLEDVRRWVEGRRYESIEAKQAAVGEFAKVESREAGLIAGGLALYS